MSTYAFYTKGSIGLNYTVGDGFSFASFGVGILDTTFYTPKWFNSLSSDAFENPNVYFGLGIINAKASLGYGISASAEIISGTVGVQFGDSASVQFKGYLGAGIKFDFSNGFKVGFGLGLCFEISFIF